MILETYSLPDSKKRVTTQNAFAAIFYSQLYSDKVSVPVVMSRDRFILDIDEMVAKTVSSMRQLSQEQKTDLLRTLVRSMNVLDDAEIRTYLIELGLKLTPREGRTEENMLSDFVSSLRERIARSITDAGLANYALKTVLDETNQSFKVNDFASISMAEVGRMLRSVNGFWAKLVTDKDATELVNYLNDATTSVPFLKATDIMTRALRESETPTLPCRASFAIDHFFNAIGERPMLTREVVVPGRINAVTHVDFPALSLSEVMYIWKWCLNASAGFITTSENEQTRSISDDVMQRLAGLSNESPGVPVEAGQVRGSIAEQAFIKVYKICLWMRILRDDSGEFAAQVNNRITGNKFFVMPANAHEFKRYVSVLSMTYSAFLDAADWFRNLLYDDTIIFDDALSLNSKTRTGLLKFSRENDDSLKANFLSADHPTYFKSALHVLNHRSMLAYSTFSSVPWVPRKSARDSMSFFAFDDKSQKEYFMTLLHAPILNGSWYDFPKSWPFSTRLMNLASSTSISRYVVLPGADAAFTGAVPMMLFRFFPVQALDAVEKGFPGIADFLRREAPVVRFDDIYQFASAMKLTIEIAAYVVKNKYGGEENLHKLNFFDLSALPMGLDFSELSFVSEYIMKDLSPDRQSLPFVIESPGLIVIRYATFGPSSPEDGNDDDFDKTDLDDALPPGGKPGVPKDKSPGPKNGNKPDPDAVKKILSLASFDIENDMIKNASPQTLRQVLNSLKAQLGRSQRPVEMKALEEKVSKVSQLLKIESKPSNPDNE